MAETTSDPNANTSNDSSGAAAGTTGSRTRTPSSSEQFAETVQMVKTYAIQETIDPVRTAGRWIAFGVLGATLIGLATGMLVLGTMRLVQTEWHHGGRWLKLLPYLFGLVLCIIVALLALRRINKDPLTKEKR